MTDEACKMPLSPAQTPFAGLNAVLDSWQRGVLDILGADVIGIYLQGSFAVGDADPNSDCDFMVVTTRDVASARSRLDDVHAAIHRLPFLPWRHRLEGSYAPADILRRWSTTPRDAPGEPRSAGWTDPGLSGLPPRAYPFLYLDHGAKMLVRSEHDNTQVVRWSLREKGIVLFGSDPRTLIDPVEHEALRNEVLELLPRIAACRLQPLDLLFWQGFWVGLLCRIAYTAETGRVVSKKAAGRWAIGRFDPRWRSLIERAQTIRDGDRVTAMAPSTQEERQAVFSFAAYVSNMHGFSFPSWN